MANDSGSGSVPLEFSSYLSMHFLHLLQNHDSMKFLYLALGGGIGAILRYLVSIFSIKYMVWGLPMGTLIVNLVGSFLIGFAFVFLGRENIALNLKIFLFIGIFGSFTTFST